MNKKKRKERGTANESDLVLQGQDRVVFGRVDVQHVEAVLPTQVVGDVGEGRARRLGHSVVDDDHVVFVCRRRRVPAAGVLTVALLDLGQLVSGDRLLCRGKTNEMFSDRYTRVCSGM